MFKQFYKYTIWSCLSAHVVTSYLFASSLGMYNHYFSHFNNESNLRNEGFLEAPSLKPWFNMVGQDMGLALQAAENTASIVQKHGEDCWHPATFSFFPCDLFWNLSLAGCCLCLERVFPFS